MKGRFGFLPPNPAGTHHCVWCIGKEGIYVEWSAIAQHIENFCAFVGEQYKPTLRVSFSQQYAEGAPSHFEIMVDWRTLAHLSTAIVVDQCQSTIPKIINECDVGHPYKNGGG
jgi:hypothetical protein